VKHGDSLPIATIRVDGSTQPRAVLDFGAIEDYAEATGAGVGWRMASTASRPPTPPASTQFPATFTRGRSQRPSVQTGTTGLRRTTQDKPRAVKAALLHGRVTVLSDRQIARHVGV